MNARPMAPGPRMWAAAAFALLTAPVAPQQAEGTAAVTGAPAGGPAPFQRVLWLPADGAADAARLARVRAAGFDAIQLGADGDAAPLRAAGLGFYLDQPVGKGFLELRDRDFEPIQQAYERTRDPAGLVRPQCLRDAELLAHLGASAAGVAAARRGPDQRFVALADEASATRHQNPLDLCRCPQCLAAFRTFARARYGSIAALNGAWASDFADFEHLEPLTTDQVRRRELGGVLLPGNLRPFADWLEFVDAGFAAAVRHLAAQVQREVPGVPVGLTGLQPPLAFGGHDYAQLLPALTLVEPYDLGGARELARSLRPEASLWATLTVPTGDDAAFEGRVTAELGALAALGAAGAVVWNEPAMFTAEGQVAPAGAALRRAFARMQGVLDACVDAVPRPASVWLVESPASVRAWWMLDSAEDGLTWVRRRQSHEVEHSTSMAARRGWLDLLADLGITAQFVGEGELPERLLQQRPRVLVLPATIALADRCCRAIAAYAQQGGTVLADHDTALYDEHLVLRSAAGLDELFGIEMRSRRWADLLVREGAVRGADGPASTPIAGADLRAQLAERAGDRIVFAERRPGRGRAVYLNLAVCTYPRLRLAPDAVGPAVDLRRRVRQVLDSADVAPLCDVRADGLPTCLARTELRTRDGGAILAVRVAALAAPALLARLAKGGRRSAHLTFARPIHLRQLDGADLGIAAAFDLQLDVCAGLFVRIVR